jgi:hypothetical protein
MEQQLFKTSVRAILTATMLFCATEQTEARKFRRSSLGTDEINSSQLIRGSKKHKIRTVQAVSDSSISTESRLEESRSQESRSQESRSQESRSQESRSQESRLAESRLAESEPEIISLDWKITTTRQFNANADFIKDVIIKGESEAAERNDFEKRFENQKKWFTQTISQASTTKDRSYSELSLKMRKMEEIANAQRFADNLLKENIDADDSKTRNDIDQLRAQVLYEINAKIETSKKQKGRTITDKELSEMVRKVINKFDSIKALSPKENKERDNAKQILEKSKKTSLELEKLELEKSKFEKSKFEKSELEKTRKANVQLEIEIEQTRREKERAEEALQTALSSDYVEKEKIKEMANSLEKSSEELLRAKINSDREKHKQAVQSSPNSAFSIEKEEVLNKAKIENSIEKEIEQYSSDSKKSNIDDPYAAFDEISDLF